MSDMPCRRIVLASRPDGEPQPENFRLETVAMPAPDRDRLLCETIYLSLDPYMRGRMIDGPSYAVPVALGDVMVGGTVGRVVAGAAGGLAPGDFVLGEGGWQSHWLADPASLRRLDPTVAPLSTALGIFGMPGLTAYVGLNEIGRPQPGETVVVAAASGAVGSAVGQLAKIAGARAVGIAGGPEKCAFVRDELGFDACLDHRDGSLRRQLQAACPDGIDVYFENVGGPVLRAVLPLMNPFGRMPVCGTIAHYNATALPEGPDRVPQLMRTILVQRLTVRGFIVFDFADRQAAFERDMGRWLAEGRIRYREDIREGLANAPDAFIKLLRGGNFGKLLVRVADDPTRVAAAPSTP